MKKIVSGFVVTSFLIVSLAGCATNMQSGALIGGAGGAGLGALLCKNKLLCAAIGGIAGAAIGMAVGHYMDRQVADRQQAIAKYNDKPAADGTVYVSNGHIRKDIVAIEKSEVNPLPMKVDGEATAAVQYSVISQYANKPVEVTERRYIVIDGDNINLAKPREIQIQQGTRLSVYKLKLPSGVQPGDYELVTEISALGQTRKAITDIRVEG